MQDIAKMIEETTAAALTPEALKASVDEKVNGAIDDVLSSMFRSYGDVFKQIEKQLSAKINVNLEDVSLPEYNVMVTDMVVAATNRAMQASMSEHLIKELNEVFSPAPAETTVRQLIEPFIESWREENQGCNCHDEFDDYATCEIEKTDYGSVSLKLWKKRREKKSYLRGDDEQDRRHDVHLFMSEEGKIRIIWDDHGDKLQFSNFATCNYNGFAKLYQMYAAGTVITDINDVDTGMLDTCLIHEY